MACCPQCRGIEEEFDETLVERELRRLRRRGPRGTTRLLIDALRERGVEGATHLDIGGGVGAIQHALLESGAARATSVDASPAYLAGDRREAERRGHEERIDFRHGDFVDLAPEVAPADVVTLDRVVCCYPDVDSLVRFSAERARRLYGLVYPRETWWIRRGVPAANLFFRLRGSEFRAYLHEHRRVETILVDLGFSEVYDRRTVMWRVSVYER